MGTDSNSSNGIELGVGATTYRYNFSIPLLSMIGVNSDKLFPIGMLNNLQLQMTTATNLPIIFYTVGGSNAACLQYSLYSKRIFVKFKIY